MKPMPPNWNLHGTFPPPKVIAGALPRTGVHYLLNSATPVVLAATIADMATSVASSIVDQPLRAVPGSQRRSPAGFLGSRGSLAPEAVAILNARIGLDMGEAIQAAALARGVTRPLDVAVTALSGGSLVATPDAARRLHDLDEFLPADIGLIIIIDNFAGTREGDAEMVRAVLAIASSFAAPILVVSDKLPAHVEPDCVVIRLSDSEISIDNPAAPNVAPFKCGISKEQISLETDEAVVVNFGPRRVHIPTISAKEIEPQPKAPVGRPKADQAGETVFLVMTGRQLEPDEITLFGESKNTPDYRTAIKWAGQSIHKRVEIVVIPNSRDPRRESAGSTVKRVQSELLNAGLDRKVSVRVSENMQIAA